MYREILVEEIKLDITLNYQYFIDYNHPLATGNSGRVYYHRHVASINAGRWLTSNEIVHHKNENKADNSPLNLEIMSVKQHNELHFRTIININCAQCHNLFKPNKNSNIYCCVKCSTEALKKIRVPIENIIQDVVNYSWTATGKKYNVSDNALRKHYIKLTGLDPKNIKIDWPVDGW